MVANDETFIILYIERIGFILRKYKKWNDISSKDKKELLTLFDKLEIIQVANMSYIPSKSLLKEAKIFNFYKQKGWIQ